jgi:hypothetical protein
MNAYQNKPDLMLSIPNITTENVMNTIYLEGYSEVPYAEIDEFENTEMITIDSDYQDIKAEYKGYLKYSKYSNSFMLKGVNNSWEIDGIHYSNRSYTIDNKTYYFENEGFDSSIQSSYLKFKTNPVSKISRVQKRGSVNYTVNCNLPVKNAVFQFYIKGEERYSIKEIKINNESIAESKLTKLHIIGDQEYYMLSLVNFNQGENSVEITYKIHNFWENLPLLVIALGIISAILVVIYIRTQKQNSTIYKIIFFYEKNNKR